MTVTNVTGNPVSVGRDVLSDHVSDSDNPHSTSVSNLIDTDVDAAAHRDSLTFVGGAWVPWKRNENHIQLTQPLDLESSVGDLWLVLT